MKKFLIWFLAFIITVSAAYYQRKTGPTYPKSYPVALNDSVYELKLVRSLGLDERPEVRLRINDTTVKAVLYYKRFRTNDEYTTVPFLSKTYPVDSYIMNRMFHITEEKGLYAAVPQQPPAGKIQYYLEITDSEKTIPVLKENPLVIRFKGTVPPAVLTPHILIMFLAMFFSTLAGLMTIFRSPKFRKYTVWTLVTMLIGGMVMGPLVQKYAFGELWTGVPFGWDLTDNKTLIAFIFWVVAVVMNRKKERPLYTLLASVLTIVVFSIPHSVLGSELDYSTGEVTQGFIMIFFTKFLKNS